MLFDALSEKVFYLSVDGAEVFVCPANEFYIEGGGEPERHLFFADFSFCFFGVGHINK